MDVDIQALAEKLIEEHGRNLRGGEGRGHEIRVDITRSLRATANRIDDGYSIEVRSYQLPESDAEEPPPEATPEAEAARRGIEERQPRMRTMNLTGTPILELPGESDGDVVEESPE